MDEEKETSAKPGLKDITKIAIPMVLSQASETINLFVDRLFLSRLGKIYISAAMSGGLTSFNVMSLFIGIIGYVNAVVAQNDGAGRKRNCARAAAQAIRMAFIGWPFLILSIPLVKMFFISLGHTPELIDVEMTYFRILIFGSIFGLIRYALAGFFIGLGRTRVVMLANFAGMLINVPANWILIFGKFGFPAMGITGAAIGTVLGSLTIMIILIGVYFSPSYRKEFGTAEELGYNKRLSKVLLKFGTPAGVENFLNVAAFNFFIQLMYSYGPDTAAAVTIAFNYDIVAFIPMMGLGFAATTLTGRYVGARNIPGAEHATKLTLAITWSFALSLVLLFVFGARPLVNVFASGLENGGIDVAPMARTMLRMAAIYTLADATQLILAGALRGAGDTQFVMRISIILHWIFTSIAWYAIKVAKISPVSMWGIFIIFVMTLGVAMFLRYRFGKWREMTLVI
ncbi:MAG: MATE family efflux transporter [Spirochaetaceae bacterium]|nr:MATE family efflux transporter [Spirochaetaceae bacterium]